ncbi:MAG: hypothetical protein JNK74_22630 [Candidatus Hydrogenedentes bacterium]|nr:hypothetical protein [Candidatus Hydrogenedentota bacterium]
MSRGTVVRTLDFPWPAGADFRIEDIRYDKEIGEADLQNYSMERMSTVSLKPASTLGYGTFTSTVEIVTNDREQLIYTLPVKGYVECPIEIVSDRLAAGLIERNKKTMVTAEFRSPYGNPISVSKVEYLKGTASSWRLLEERNGIYPLEFELVPPDDPKSKVSIALLRVEVSAGTYKRTFEIEAMGIIN